MTTLDLAHQSKTAATEPPEAIGFLAGTQVMTAEGELPVELLGLGDRVITRRGIAKVVEIEIRSQQDAQVIVVSPDTLGIGRPGAEVRLAPDQRVLVRDWRAKALWGVAEAAVPVSQLVDGEFIRQERVALAHFVTLRLTSEAVVMAGGLDLCCPAAALAVST
ncbi:Hint domain-containing protein [Fuscibacter oryzae]|uniref:Hint domain-containing protein n=1 Tax=Fuscibacter oryzae TaxID=2803939 RepID=A0A8J7SRT3_9RHOB|nr:Hint domain-containing protein [Fuscibacter oryzae]MBL4927831.1 Hint domain-containing protein [Fuscibacter oryzae]